MSGPTTAIFTAEPATVLLAAAALRAAEAIAGAARAADALAARNADADAARQAGQAAARAAGQQALQARRAALEARAAGLAAAGITLPAAPPDGAPHAVLAAYVEALAGLCAAAPPPAADAATDPFADPAFTAEVLGDEAAATLDALLPAAPAAASGAESPSAGARRLLARLAAQLAGQTAAPDPAAAGIALPEALTAGARAIATAEAAGDRERAAMLLLELRRAIQEHHARAVEAASARVLAHTLADLGYVVEPISETLFFEGGVAHFSRPGWADYLVRLRVDPRTASINFNVIRAVDAGNHERSVLDHLAEDRWCAEFPALLRALEARGLRLAVTRRLAAGECPVQRVDRARLPQLAAAGAADTAAREAPRQQAMPR